MSPTGGTLNTYYEDRGKRRIHQARFGGEDDGHRVARRSTK